MNRKLKTVQPTRADLEKAILEKKAIEQDKCSKELNAVLEKYGCGLQTIVQIGEVAYTLDKVLAAPSQVVVLSK